jgi:hypothetical protein
MQSGILAQILFPLSKRNLKGWPGLKWAEWVSKSSGLNFVQKLKILLGSQPIENTVVSPCKNQVQN